MKMTQESLDGDITRIALQGRLDIEGTQAVDQQFAFASSRRAGRYIVDLAGVSFISSIGIRMLLSAARAQASRGGKLVILGPAGMGTEVLKTAGVDLIVPLVADLPAARAALAPAA